MPMYTVNGFFTVYLRRTVSSHLMRCTHMNMMRCNRTATNEIGRTMAVEHESIRELGRHFASAFCTAMLAIDEKLFSSCSHGAKSVSVVMHSDTVSPFVSKYSMLSYVYMVYASNGTQKRPTLVQAHFIREKSTWVYEPEEVSGLKSRAENREHIRTFF